MTKIDTDLEILDFLAGFQREGVRARYIASILGLPTDRKGIGLMRARLNRLKKRGLVSEYKAHPECKRTYWRITEGGRSELASIKEAITAVMKAAEEKLRQMPAHDEVL
jgi:hypothetical protein